jgi:hypothetical protein
VERLLRVAELLGGVGHSACGAAFLRSPRVQAAAARVDLVGREMDSSAGAVGGGALEHYFAKGEPLGPSWILL